MGQSSLKIGIVGCGGIADFHLNAWKENGILPVAFADQNPAASEAMVKKCGGGTVYPDFRRLIESGGVDAISICTPPVAHEEAAVLALQRGKHVLCEKPLANSIESARRIVEAQRKSGALLMTAFCHRFRPAIQQIRSMIQSGRIGPVVFFRNVFCGPADDMKHKWFSKKAIAGGGTMLDGGVHSVDLFRFLVGEVVEQNLVQHRHLEGTDVEDAAILSVRSASGALGCLMCSWVAGVGIFQIDVVGRNGRIIFDYGTEIRVIPREGDEEKIPVPAAWGFTEEVAHFLAAIQKREKLAVTGEDGLRAVEIICSCYERGKNT